MLAWFYWRDMQRARGTQAFFAALTHELRTPLTSVRLQTEAIAAGEPTQELAIACWRTRTGWNRRSTRRWNWRASKAVARWPSRPSASTRWLERVLRGIAGARGRAAELAVIIEPELPPMHGDTAALQLILRNLVENSVRHGDRSRIHIDVAARPRLGWWSC